MKKSRFFSGVSLVCTVLLLLHSLLDVEKFRIVDMDRRTSLRNRDCVLKGFERCSLENSSLPESAGIIFSSFSRMLRRARKSFTHIFPCNSIRNTQEFSPERHIIFSRAISKELSAGNIFTGKNKAVLSLYIFNMTLLL